MEIKFSVFDWIFINNLDNFEKSVKLLNISLWLMFNESFLFVRVRVLFRDLFYMFFLVKYFCKVRNKIVYWGN